ncbi:helix-turn-helix transcriptional regulator [Rubinisphaera brasiliensis]|uniref:Uncharacterized protein n=1 Tax=Rubinisphaera brasiliensis (strain ATCC 49424 / DSM 5305 / JCM 21570 / IAM 15109 / NBRC 103401 / IFAM 1448) TaxID=756272 RepID=F0SGF1_RUBBR|nr:helix-turn-helix transcriptional regulator [Rubinisphaera brasiliensis]ADY60550.1 hypothetical protein Plabr_2951 [Rubinisphaera brasiliensis DSM 5305]
MSHETQGDRVRWLLREVWNGHQTKMAQDTECSQSTLSLVASGKKEPGKRLLALIEAHPKVNAEWLYNGRGKPLVAVKETDNKIRDSLPVATRPLPGPPGDTPTALTDQRQVVVANHLNQTSYVLVVQGDEPIVDDIELGVRPGDRLLIDASMDSIPEKQRLFRTLCVVRRPGRTDHTCLGLVTYIEADKESGPERIEVDTFDVSVPRKDIEVQRWTVLHRGKEREHAKYYRKIGTPGNLRLEPIGDLELDPPLPRILYSDIVGVCKMLMRTKF